MGILELHERALDQTDKIVAGVNPDQLGLPTPCSEWDVRMLLNHLVGGNRNSAATAESTPRQGGAETQDLLGDDPVAAYRQSAEAVKGAWRQPGRLAQLYEMPMGTLTGQGVLSIRVLETVTHGWDLARATGQAPKFDDDIVQAAAATAHASLGGERPPGMPFAAAVEAGDDLPAVDRLAAFMGRRPDHAAA